MQLKGQEKVGITRNVITGRNYGSPVVFTFTERSDLLVYTTLKGWMDSTVLNSGQEGLDQNLRVQYYDANKCLIQIDKLEPQLPEGFRTNSRQTQGLISEADYRRHRITGSWRLQNAIPVAIEQTTMAIESADSALDFTVSIAFETFTYQSMRPAVLDTARNRRGR